MTDEVVVPTYPVVQYGHVPTGGDAIGSGYVYNGKALPALRGKYIFSDLSTGRVWYADWKEMLAADDGESRDDGADARSEAVLERSGPRHLHVDRGGCVSVTRAARIPICRAAAPCPGSRRADARFALDAAGELFVYSKTDGMIRQVVCQVTLSTGVRDQEYVFRAGPVLGPVDQ